MRTLLRGARAVVRARAEGRPPGLRTAKTVLAAVLAYVVAEWLGTSAQPVLAPLTALLVVQLTLYETARHGIERIASVLAGVLVAVGVASLVGLTWWSLGLVVALSLVVGRVMRLGPHLLEVPISAMLVLAATRAEDIAVERVYETLIGAAVGLVVNAAIAPPLYVQPAGEALAELADDMSDFLRRLGADLRQGWSRAAADQWLEHARGFGADVTRADATLDRAEESARLNPRAGRVHLAQPRLRTALTGLELCYILIRLLCRALLDRTYFVPAEEEGTAYGEEVRIALADVLDTAALAVDGLVAAAAESSDGARREVDAALVELQHRRDLLAELLVVDPHTDQGAWQQHGALLAAIDRLRVEVEAAARPPETAWRPPRLSERQRQAVRRIVEGRARRRRARQPS